MSKEEDSKKDKYKNLASILKPMFFYTSSSIFAPLLIFGGIGYLLDKKFSSSPKILLVSLVISFVFTNVLLFKKIKAITNEMNDSSDNNSSSKDKSDKLKK